LATDVHFIQLHAFAVHFQIRIRNSAQIFASSVASLESKLQPTDRKSETQTTTPPHSHNECKVQFKHKSIKYRRYDVDLEVDLEERAVKWMQNHEQTAGRHHRMSGGQQATEAGFAVTLNTTRNQSHSTFTSHHINSID